VTLKGLARRRLDRSSSWRWQMSVGLTPSSWRSPLQVTVVGVAESRNIKVVKLQAVIVVQETCASAYEAVRSRMRTLLH